MKKQLVLLLVTTFSLGLGSTSAFAKKHHESKACKAVYKACKKAKGKKGAKACVESIKSGGTVDGVSDKLTQDEITACSGGAATPAQGGASGGATGGGTPGGGAEGGAGGGATGGATGGGT